VLENSVLFLIDPVCLGSGDTFQKSLLSDLEQVSSRLLYPNCLITISKCTFGGRHIVCLRSYTWHVTFVKLVYVVWRSKWMDGLVHHSLICIILKGSYTLYTFWRSTFVRIIFIGCHGIWGKINEGYFVTQRFQNNVNKELLRVRDEVVVLHSYDWAIDQFIMTFNWCLSDWEKMDGLSHVNLFRSKNFLYFFFYLFISFLRLLALRPFLAYCASLGW
jgi:hypothetical protein